MSRFKSSLTSRTSAFGPAVLVALGLLGPSDLPASAGISGSSLDNGDGTFTYSYTIENIGGVFDIFAFSLEFNFDAVTRDWDPADTGAGGDVTVADPGWIALEGIPSLGLSAQDFVSLSRSSDVLIGSSLGIFSFVSSIPPSSVRYVTFGAQGESDSGQTVGPGIVPESSTLLAAGVLAMGCVWIVSKRRP